MGDSLVVRGRQTARHLQCVVHRLTDRDRSRLQPLAQRLALQKFGDEVRRALLVPSVVDGEYVGVVEKARRPGLVLEATTARRVRG
jgi:hypothetical protein